MQRDAVGVADVQYVREQMEIRANGNISRQNLQNDWKWEYFLSNETVLSTQTLQNIQNGNPKPLQVIREQMGIFLVCH